MKRLLIILSLSLFSLSSCATYQIQGVRLSSAYVESISYNFEYYDYNTIHWLYINNPYYFYNTFYVDQQGIRRYYYTHPYFVRYCSYRNITPNHDYYIRNRTRRTSINSIRQQTPTVRNNPIVRSSTSVRSNNRSTIRNNNNNNNIPNRSTTRRSSTIRRNN